MGPKKSVGEINPNPNWSRKPNHSSVPACRIPRDILNPIKVKSAFLRHVSLFELLV